MTDVSPAAVLLDAAGTLIHPARPVGETYAAVASEHGATLEPAALDGAFRAVFPRMPPMAFPPVGTSELDRLERGWWGRLVSDVLLACDGAVDDFDGFFADLYERFALAEAWAVYAEVEAALDALHGAGLRLVVVSNFDSRLSAILEGHGLADRLEAVVYSTRAGAAKPDGRIFRTALEILDLPAERVIHVGDNRAADYDGARAAGLQARWLVREGQPTVNPPAHVVGDLRRFAEQVLSAAG